MFYDAFMSKITRINLVASRHSARVPSKRILPGINLISVNRILVPPRLLCDDAELLIHLRALALLQDECLNDYSAGDIYTTSKYYATLPHCGQRGEQNVDNLIYHCRDPTSRNLEVQHLVVLHGYFTGSKSAPLGNSLPMLAIDRNTRLDPLFHIYWHQ